MRDTKLLRGGAWAAGLALLLFPAAAYAAADGGAAGGGGAAAGGGAAGVDGAAAGDARPAPSDIYFRLAAGAGHPFAANLRHELSTQGTSAPSTGYTAGVSLGRSFGERRWSSELWFEVSRSRYFDYYNEYEDFVAYISDYAFMLVGKRNLLPASERSAAYVGAGLGYGHTSITGGAGKVDGIRAMLLLQHESRLRDNISLLIEGSYISALREKRYDSPYLAASDDDGIIGGDGAPLSERFASLSLRLGVVVRLVPPSPYSR